MEIQLDIGIEVCRVKIWNRPHRGVQLIRSARGIGLEFLFKKLKGSQTTYLLQI